MNPRAVEYMREVGYDLTTHTSKSLDQFNGQEVEVAVTMGCGNECPLVRAKRREGWQIPDPKVRLDVHPSPLSGVALPHDIQPPNPMEAFSPTP